VGRIAGVVPTSSCHVLVPVKRLDAVKARLSGVLSAEQRAALMLELLETVLAAVAAADVGPVTVVSGDPLPPNGVARWDDRGLAWNDALAAAMREIVAEPIAAVVSADLPHLSADDVRALVEATPVRGIVIARATDGGTNAVAMRPPGALATLFGQPASSRRHAEAAAAHDLDHVLLDLPGLAFDVDTPADLERLRAAACR
jgi:2-phospho-L-lactate/phosphoenolpyruvate guanylyltransferase